MPLDLRERQVQIAARAIGLKLIVDRFEGPHTGRERYYLRPIWDARRVVRVLPDGGYELATVAGRRRYVVRPLPLEDIELLLVRWKSSPRIAASIGRRARRRSPSKHVSYQAPPPSGSRRSNNSNTRVGLL
jgi:hypothetical protein